MSRERRQAKSGRTSLSRLSRERGGSPGLRPAFVKFVGTLNGESARGIMSADYRAEIEKRQGKAFERELGPFERINWRVYCQVRMKRSSRWDWVNISTDCLSSDIAMAFAGALATAFRVRRVAVEAEVVSYEHVVDRTWTEFKKPRGRKKL